MTEAELKRELVKLLRATYPNYVIWRIEDGTTSGIPDITINGRKRTSYWEVKYANPDFKVKGIQKETIRKLSREGFAFYIVYYESLLGRRTYIIDPADIDKEITSWERSVPGFDHTWLTLVIGEVHRGNY